MIFMTHLMIFIMALASHCGSPTGISYTPQFRFSLPATLRVYTSSAAHIRLHSHSLTTLVPRPCKTTSGKVACTVADTASDLCCMGYCNLQYPMQQRSLAVSARPIDFHLGYLNLGPRQVIKRVRFILL